MFKKITTFLKEVKEEMGKVNWLSRSVLVRYTLIVIIVSIVVALYLWACDLLFSRVLNLVIGK